MISLLMSVVREGLVMQRQNFPVTMIITGRFDAIYGIFTSCWAPCETFCVHYPVVILTSTPQVLITQI